MPACLKKVSLYQYSCISPEASGGDQRGTVPASGTRSFLSGIQAVLDTE